MFSFSSYGLEMDVEFFQDDSALLTYPSLGDQVLISSNSNQDGICKAFGYQRAAIGSMVTGSQYRGPLIVIAYSGVVFAGQVSNSQSGFEVKQLVCLNKLTEPQFKTFFVEPLHLNAKVPFSSKSNQRGVCRALGYDDGAPGSAIFGNSYRGPMVVVNDNGDVVSGDVATSTSGFEINSLVCVNNN